MVLLFNLLLTFVLLVCVVLVNLLVLGRAQVLFKDIHIYIYMFKKKALSFAAKAATSLVILQLLKPGFPMTPLVPTKRKQGTRLN